LFRSFDRQATSKHDGRGASNKFLAAGAWRIRPARANQFFTLHNQPLGAGPRFPREPDASACRL